MRGQVLKGHDERPRLRRSEERLDVLRRRDEQPLGDPARIDVLVPHSFLSRRAGRGRLRRVENARASAPNRGVVSPVAITRGNDIAVVGPCRIEDRRRCGRGVELPAPGTIRDDRWPGDVDVVAEERHGPLRKQGEVRGVYLELIQGRDGQGNRVALFVLQVGAQSDLVLRDARGGECERGARKSLRDPEVDRVASELEAKVVDCQAEDRRGAGGLELHVAEDPIEVSVVVGSEGIVGGEEPERVVEPLVVVKDHQTTLRKRELRHELVSACEEARPVVPKGRRIDGDGRAPGQAIRGARHDDLGVGVRRVSLSPGDVNPGGVGRVGRGRDRREGVGPEPRPRRPLVKGGDRRDLNRILLVEALSEVRRLRDEDRVRLAGVCEDSPRDVDGSVRRIDGDRGALVNLVALAQSVRLAPGLAAVE